MRLTQHWTDRVAGGVEAVCATLAAGSADRLAIAAAALLDGPGGGAHVGRVSAGGSDATRRAFLLGADRHARRGLHLQRHSRSRHRRQGRAHAAAAAALRRGVDESGVGVAAGAMPDRPGGASRCFRASRRSIALVALPLVALYPLMKRITWWPQAWLGIVFSWGALVGGAATTSHSGMLPLEALALYAGCIAWTIGYDTIYALQDREDDALDRRALDGASVRQALAHVDEPLLRAGACAAG